MTACSLLTTFAGFAQVRGGDQAGLGLVTVEAIGCGCPVVVGDLPAVRDVVGNPDLRVPLGDPSKLAVAIGRIMASGVDERATFAAKLRAHVVDKFDWDMRARRYSEILSGLEGSKI